VVARSLAAGNSNGDIPMLDFTQHDDKPFLRLLVLHDDGEREFDYTSGAEQALERAEAAGWTIVSIKDDWLTVLVTTSRAGVGEPAAGLRDEPPVV
jgi:hypothetical protein